MQHWLAVLYTLWRDCEHANISCMLRTRWGWKLWEDWYKRGILLVGAGRACFLHICGCQEYEGDFRRAWCFSQFQMGQEHACDPHISKYQYEHWCHTNDDLCAGADCIEHRIERRAEVIMSRIIAWEVYWLGLILGGSLFYARVTVKTLVVFNFKVPQVLAYLPY